MRAYASQVEPGRPLVLRQSAGDDAPAGSAAPDGGKGKAAGNAWLAALLCEPLTIPKNNGDEARQYIPDSCALVCRFFLRSIPLILLGGWYH